MKKVLIANRGEIAVRVLRTCREMGYSPVAVYSDADRGALHVRWADEAYHLGGSAPSESYLAIDKLVDVARRAGIWGVHPGYGFLSENAAFAKACEDAGLVFIGPHSSSIAAMGDKIESRLCAAKAGLSMTPSSGVLASASQAEAEAKKLGFPVLLKARAGGGGKGMRVAREPKEVAEAFRLAQSEAQKSFRDPTLYMEKFVVKPRHIEVQVFGDKHGNLISLGDRECSIQRRHQKLVEEATAPNLQEETHQKLSKAACAVARAVDYLGAGTVEFLVDAEENIYFLEMNTRLQVEHPVTEWVTGLDLVEWQLRVAEGEKLPLKQDEVSFRGHAIEVRLCAEDASHGFLPCPGTITALHWPSGPGVRVDTAAEPGGEVTTYYDPMLAKISVWAPTRTLALRKLRRALEELRVGGITTNAPFLLNILRHPRVEAGHVTTTFLQEEGKIPARPLTDHDMDAALAGAILAGTANESPSVNISAAGPSPWWRAGLPSAKAKWSR